MHQIRVQAARAAGRCAAMCCMVPALPFGPPTELPRDRVIALARPQLDFLHPIRYEPITVTAPLPELWPTELRLDNP